MSGYFFFALKVITLAAFVFSNHEDPTIMSMPETSQATPIARLLLNRLDNAIAALSYPSLLAYTVTVIATERDGSIHRRTYDSRYNASEGDIFPTTISREEGSNPPDARGVDFSIALPFVHVSLNKPIEADALGGPPSLAPYYFFGLGESEGLSTDSKRHAQFTIRSNVPVSARNYEVYLVSIEMVRGEACNHLRLRPRIDPRRFRIRDIWMAQSDDLPIQIRTFGNFTNSRLTNSSWLTTYRRDGHSLFILDERTTDDLRFAHFKPFVSSVVSFSLPQPISPSDMRLRLKPNENKKILAEPNA